MKEAHRDTSQLTDGMTDRSWMGKLYNKMLISEALERAKHTHTHAHTLTQTHSPMATRVPGSRTQRIEGRPKCAASCREIH